MGHRSHAPKSYSERVRASPSNSVDDPSGAQESNRRGELECRGQAAIVAVGPVEVLLQHRLQHGDDLAVSVIEHDRYAYQAEDEPPLRSPEPRGVAHATVSVRHL